jgi:hypothetical protein
MLIYLMRMIHLGFSRATFDQTPWPPNLKFFVNSSFYQRKKIIEFLDEERNFNYYIKWEISRMPVGPLFFDYFIIVSDEEYVILKLFFGPKIDEWIQI